jgi:purine catabolism regulator
MGGFRKMITVQDVLITKIFENSHVLAGENGLTRVVNTITVAEVPDAANWLEGGELVCTTGFFISKEIGEYQTKWVESLIANGASALAIKSGRFLGAIPNSILELANRLNFPLIEMPPDIIWPIAIQAVMNLLTDQQTKVLQRAAEIHSRLTQLVLENESIQAISDVIASLVGNPIVVEDARLNIIAVGNVVSDQPAEIYPKVMDKRMGEPFRNKILLTDYYKSVVKGRKKDRFEVNVSDAKDVYIRNIMIPILSNKVVYGFLSLIEVEKPYSAIDLIALEHGATALALQFMKQIINEQTLRTKTLTLIDDLVHGRYHTEIVSEHHFYNFNRSNPMLVIMMQTSTEQPSEEYYSWNHSEELIRHTLRKYIEKHFDQLIIGNDDSLFTILVSFPHNMIAKVTTILKEALKQALNELKQQFGIQRFRIGMGSAYQNLSSLGRSYKEANGALSIAKSFPKLGEIILFENLGIHRIISMIHNVEDLQIFCNDFLLELKTYDNENGGMLLETLYAYIKSNGSVNEAAAMLFVHPNTVSYRLRKIKQVIKYDITDAQFRFSYLFALEANFMLNDSI